MAVNLRNEARGRSCQIRLVGCEGGFETTVGAHYALAGLTGMGMKPDDLFIAWACHSCHAIVDGRKPYGGDRSVVRLAHAEGVFRTQAVLKSEGKLG